MSFDFEKKLSDDARRANIDYVSYIVGSDKNALNEIINLIYTAKHPINQRAAGVLETVSRIHPELIEATMNKFIDTFQDFGIAGIRRNLMKMFTRFNYNDSQKARLINIGFSCLTEKKESIAVKAYAMEVLFNISQSIPEIKQELILIIEDGMYWETAAWKARGRKMLGKLLKQTKG